MFQILRKPNFILNPDDKIVNGILKGLERTNGVCPCIHPESDGDLHCPCDSYKLRDKCICKLYIPSGIKHVNE